MSEHPPLSPHPLTVSETHFTQDIDPSIVADRLPPISSCRLQSVPPPQPSSGPAPKSTDPQPSLGPAPKSTDPQSSSSPPTGTHDQPDSDQNDSGPDYYTSDSDSDLTDSEDELSPKQRAKRDRLRIERDAIKPSYYYGEKELDQEAIEKGIKPPKRKRKGCRGVPVFEPSMEQFQDFYSYINLIDRWGMRSGIVKIVPPKEWTEQLPNLGQESLRTDGQGQMLRKAKIKSPISQVIQGSRGLYRVMNVAKRRNYNALEWFDLANSPEHRPPDFSNKTLSEFVDPNDLETLPRTRSTRSSRRSATTIEPILSQKATNARRRKVSKLYSTADQSNASPVKIEPKESADASHSHSSALPQEHPEPCQEIKVDGLNAPTPAPPIDAGSNDQPSSIKADPDPAGDDGELDEQKDAMAENCSAAVDLPAARGTTPALEINVDHPENSPITRNATSARSPVPAQPSGEESNGLRPQKRLDPSVDGPDESQDSSPEEIKHPSTEEIKHPSTEEIKHPSTEEIKHSSTEESGNPISEEIQKPSTEEIRNPGAEEIIDITLGESQNPSAQDITNPSPDERQDPTTKEIHNLSTEETGISTAEEIKNNPGSEDTNNPGAEESQNPAPEETKNPDAQESENLAPGETKNLETDESKNPSPEESKKNKTKRLPPSGPTPEEWATFVERYDKLPYGASKSDYTFQLCREIEQEYWRTIGNGGEPVYGADTMGSLFDERTKNWNVANLDNLLTRLKLKKKIPGVNTPYLYFGSWRATFAWHVEDADLYSINYIHFGAPKLWYSIPQEHNQRFENFMSSSFAKERRTCPQFLRHKAFLASPSVLNSVGVQLNKVVHLPGEIILTYPYGYHSGFNLGYNCAESVNFANEAWIEKGKKAQFCRCIDDAVTINVDAWLQEHAELCRKESESNNRAAQKLKRQQQSEQRKRQKEEPPDGDAASPKKKKKLANSNAVPGELQTKPKSADTSLVNDQTTASASATKPAKKPRAKKKSLPGTDGKTSTDTKAEKATKRNSIAANPNAPVSNQTSHKKTKRSAASQKKTVFPCALCPDLSEEGLLRIVEDSQLVQNNLAAEEGAQASSRPPPEVDPSLCPIKQEGDDHIKCDADNQMKCEDDLISELPKLDQTPQKPIKRAHKVCCMFTPSTWFERLPTGEEVVRGFDAIEKARWGLKCQLCNEKMGTKVQCTKSAKCAKACHVTCGLKTGTFLLDVKLMKDNYSYSLLDPSPDGPPPGLDVGQDPTFVVLCKQHNPIYQRAEAERKARELALKIASFTEGQAIKVKTNQGVFQVLFNSRDAIRKTLRVTFEDGHAATMTYSKVYFGSADPYSKKVNNPSNPTPSNPTFFQDPSTVNRPNSAKNPSGPSTSIQASTSSNQPQSSEIPIDPMMLIDSALLSLAPAPSCGVSAQNEDRIDSSLMMTARPSPSLTGNEASAQPYGDRGLADFVQNPVQDTMMMTAQNASSLNENGMSDQAFNALLSLDYNGMPVQNDDRMDASLMMTAGTSSSLAGNGASAQLYGDQGRSDFFENGLNDTMMMAELSSGHEASALAYGEQAGGEFLQSGIEDTMMMMAGPSSSMVESVAFGQTSGAQANFFENEESKNLDDQGLLLLADLSTIGQGPQQLPSCPTDDATPIFPFSIQNIPVPSASTLDAPTPLGSTTPVDPPTTDHALDAKLSAIQAGLIDSRLL